MTALIDLHSPAMDDAEPTQAADVPDDETQSIHAWSQADDAATDLAVTEDPRSWRLPLALAGIAAAAAISVGAVVTWPHHPAATHPTPAPTAAPTTPVAQPTLNMSTSPPALPEDPDQRFLALLDRRGQIVVSAPLAIHAGHWVCTAEAQGFTDPQIAQNLVDGTPGGDLRTESVFVDTAREVFCR